MPSTLTTVMMAVLLLTPVIGAAKEKSSDPKKPVQADCVYRGSFTAIEDVKIGGKDLEPSSVSVGHFKATSLIRGKHELCTAFKKEFDVLFSNGKSKKIGWGEGCSRPVNASKKYEIALSVGLENSFIPADCHRWVKEIP